MNALKKMKKVIAALFICLCIGMVSPEAVLQVTAPVEVQAAVKVATPKLVSAKESGKTGAVVKWKSVKGANGYVVYGGTNYSKLKAIKMVTGASKTSYVHTGLKKGKRYYYTVRAYKKVNGKNILSGYDKKGVNVIVGLSSLKLNKTSLTLVEGKSYNLKINGTAIKPVWKSGKSSVASVNSSGKVTAKKSGSATITATLDGKKFSCKVTVKKKASSTSNTTAASYTQLKDYITKHGTTNSSGNKFIKVVGSYKGVEYTWAIVYEKKNDNYLFIMNMDNGDIATSIQMDANVVKSGNVKADYLFLYRSVRGGFETQATFAAKNYTGKNVIPFTVKSTTGGVTNAEMSEVSNLCLQAGFVGWENIVKDRVGISMKKLGFSSYKLP